jgi:hypothetical protein
MITLRRRTFWEDVSHFQTELLLHIMSEQKEQWMSKHTKLWPISWKCFYVTLSETNQTGIHEEIRKRENWEYFVFMSVIWKLKDYDVGGTVWRSWLRHYATANKVAVSIADGGVVIEIFHWHNPSGSTMALGSTQPLSKGGRCVGMTTLQPTYVDCLKIICFVWICKVVYLDLGEWKWQENWDNLHT